MFLTKQAIRKIIILSAVLFGLGTLLVLLGVLSNVFDTPSNYLFVFGGFEYLFCGFYIFTGRYSEGKAKLINSATKLIRNELKPAEFLMEYNAIRFSNDLVVNKPDFDVLQRVATAYDLLDDEENALLTVEQMIATSKGKKKNRAYLLKASLLYSNGKTEEAEALFFEVQKQKLDVISKSLCDTILKGDRALALGDYKTAEAYFLKSLTQSFPKADKLMTLIYYHKLGEIYEKTKEPQKALYYYQYCIENGGATAIRRNAAESIARLSNPAV